LGCFARAFFAPNNFLLLLFPYSPLLSLPEGKGTSRSFLLPLGSEREEKREESKEQRAGEKKRIAVVFVIWVS
jgi:hypothetical protein